MSIPMVGLASSSREVSPPSASPSITEKSTEKKTRGGGGRLDDASIELLFNEIDSTHSGRTTRRSIEASLLAVYQGLVPTPKPYHLLHTSRSADWDLFLETLFPPHSSSNDDVDDASYSLEGFKTLVHAWELPSIRDAEPDDCPNAVVLPPRTMQDRLSRFLQRLRTSCATSLHRYIFIAVVVSLQVSLALWQFFVFFNNAPARAAFGTGVLVAKAATGALYPTLTLMVFSMSRWTQHFLRQSKYLRRFVDWEYARTFHIKMACLSFLLGFIHAIAHLTGTYRHGLAHPQALAVQIASKDAAPLPKTYADFMKWRASWTGLVALAFFTVMSLCGSPAVRKRSYELFQWSHLLMFPLFAMLLVHGSGAILKQPILGWWLLLPILLVVAELLYRIYRGFVPLEATVLLAEDNMVALSIKVRNKLSRFRPGQYIYLQIPSISRFQWHPFTVSKISPDSIVIHVRATAGNWTSSLYQKSRSCEKLVVAMEGPYGSPTREFYRYDNTLIFGAGIGITPFSAILFDLFDKLGKETSPWADSTALPRRFSHPKITPVEKAAAVVSNGGTTESIPSAEEWRLSRMRENLQRKSISLHWTVRTLQDLQWLSMLLNQLSSSVSVKISVHLYVTQADRDKHISTIIFRNLLDHHRVDSIQRTSALTGLIQTCHFARPNLESIMDDYHCAYSCMDVQQDRPRKVGVIYCGPVALGRLLSRKCQNLTSRARAEPARLRYHYHSESF